MEKIVVSAWGVSPWALQSKMNSPPTTYNIGMIVSIILCPDNGLSTHEAGRGHATPHMPVETAK